MDKSLIEYIETVCKDAALFDGRENDAKWQFCIIRNYLIFGLKTKYPRVRYVIIRRLANNLERHFGYQFKVLLDSARDMPNLNPKYLGFAYYPIRDGIDFNYSFAKWDYFGTPVTIQCFCDESILNPNHRYDGETFASKHVEELYKLHGLSLDMGMDECLDKGYFPTWDEYCDDYEKLYGTRPMTITETYKNY